MGEVYRARDTKLQREVAIKTLPEGFAQDPERLARFQREAQLLASLNHPNIAAIYGLEESGGVRFLVLELVEGETLAERIHKGALPVEEALTLCRQIADGLEAAHEKGVVHRDLKPANVKVTPEGKVKILDFGLAKAFAGDTPILDPSNSPTLTAAATQAGVILGTAAYMSPEQARGRAVDKRTDIWAFGAVLFEMLAGRQVFGDEDVSMTLSKVLQREPDFDALPPSVPARISQVLRLCLRKDPKQRAGDIRDVRLALEGAFETPVPRAAEPAAPALRAWQRPWAASLAVALVAVVTGLAVWNLKPPPRLQTRPVERFVIALPPDASLVRNSPTSVIAFSPDGSHLTYVAAGNRNIQQLYLRAMDAPEATPMAGTEGAYGPFFSPDGKWIGFFSGSTLKKISVSGGAAQTLCNILDSARGGSWGPDDTIIFTPSNGPWGLVKVPSAGGEPQPFTTLQQGELSHRWPQFLPDGKTILFTIATSASHDDAQIAAQRLDSGKRKILIRGGTYARYLPAGPTGYLVYYRAGTLMAVPFDPATLEPMGSPAPVVEGVMGNPATGVAQFSFSNLGSLVPHVQREGATADERPDADQRRAQLAGRVEAEGAGG
jgi:serine/threonine-protein kinase